MRWMDATTEMGRQRRRWLGRTCQGGGLLMGFAVDLMRRSSFDSDLVLVDARGAVRCGL